MKPRIEIKPARFSNAARFLALEAILLPACVSATINGGPVGFRLFGIFGLVFVGLGGLAGLYVMLSRTWSFALTQDGIEVNGNNVGYKATLIPWADVALIGVATIHRREVVGIRLSSYDRYLASRGVSASNDYGVWLLVWLIRVIRLLSATVVAGRVARAGAGGGPALAAWRGASDIAGILRGNRAASGYDIVFGWNSLDRPPRAMVQAIENYRRGPLVR